MGVFRRLLNRALVFDRKPKPGDPLGIVPELGASLWVALHEREPLADVSDGEARYLGYVRGEVPRTTACWTVSRDWRTGKSHVENALPVAIGRPKLDQGSVELSWITVGARPWGSAAWIAKLELAEPIVLDTGDSPVIEPGQLRMVG